MKPKKTIEKKSLLGKVNDLDFLYARPKEKVRDADWLGFLKAKLTDYHSDSEVLEQKFVRTTT